MATRRKQHRHSHAGARLEWVELSTQTALPVLTSSVFHHQPGDSEARSNCVDTKLWKEQGTESVRERHRMDTELLRIQPCAGERLYDAHRAHPRPSPPGAAGSPRGAGRPAVLLCVLTEL